MNIITIIVIIKKYNHAWNIITTTTITITITITIKNNNLDNIKLGGGQQGVLAGAQRGDLEPVRRLAVALTLHYIVYSDRRFRIGLTVYTKMILIIIYN